MGGRRHGRARIVAILIREIRLAAPGYQTSLGLRMRRLISSLIVLASTVSASGLSAGQLTKPASAKSLVSGGSLMMADQSNASVMRPGSARSATFSRSQKPELLLRGNGTLRQTRRPVDRMPTVSTQARFPLADSRLIGSSGKLVHSPDSAVFRPSLGGGKLQRRR